MAPNFFAKLQIFSETTHYIDARKAILMREKLFLEFSCLFKYKECACQSYQTKRPRDCPTLHYAHALGATCHNVGEERNHRHRDGVRQLR